MVRSTGHVPSGLTWLDQGSLGARETIWVSPRVGQVRQVTGLLSLLPLSVKVEPTLGSYRMELAS